MAKPKYTFSLEGLYQNKVDPQAVGEHIEDLIAKKNGYLTNEDLVTAARSTSSPMYYCYTWNDAEAAEKQRKREAKNLIKVLRIEKGEKTTEAFEYVHHPEHGGKRVLMSHRSVAANQWALEEVSMRDARHVQTQLKTFIKNWGGTPEMKDLVKDMKKLQKKIEREFLAMV